MLDEPYSTKHSHYRLARAVISQRPGRETTLQGRMGSRVKWMLALDFMRRVSWCRVEMRLLKERSEVKDEMHT